MSSVISTISQRRRAARSERDMWRVINSAGNPAVRDELIVMHQHRGGVSR